MAKNNPRHLIHLPLRLLRFVIAWAFMIIYWPVILGLHLLILKRTPPLIMMRAIRLWARATFKTLKIRIHVLNPSTFETIEARVVICNHQSTLDLPWGGYICPPSPVTIGKKEVIWIPILNLMFWALDFIRIDRANTAKALASLEGVADRIRKDRRSLVVAPEGTRSPTGELLPFKKGAFHIAIQAQAPIHPVVVHGAFECLPKSRFLPVPGDIYIQFLDPISTVGLVPTQAGELSFKTESLVRQALQKLRASYPLGQH